MKEREQVPELTTNRLSVYLRCLNTLDAAGVKTISSKALAEQFHLNAAQIRKDLAYFGEFGVKLKHVDLTVSLESLSFFLAREEQGHE